MVCARRAKYAGGCFDLGVTSCPLPRSCIALERRERPRGGGGYHVFGGLMAISVCHLRWDKLDFLQPCVMARMAKKEMKTKGMNLRKNRSREGLFDALRSKVIRRRKHITQNQTSGNASPSLTIIRRKLNVYSSARHPGSRLTTQSSTSASCRSGRAKIRKQVNPGN